MLRNLLLCCCAVSLPSSKWESPLTQAAAYCPSPTTIRQRQRTDADISSLHDTHQDEFKGKGSSDANDDYVCAWQRIGPPIVTLTSPWLKVIAERYSTSSGQKNDELIDYWRIERASSVIVIVIHQGRYILPAPQFRPGLQRSTLDFVGGRRGTDESVVETARRLLTKELNLSSEIIQKHVDFLPLSEDKEGWPVDSSVSNQALYGAVATLDDDAIEAQSTWKAQGVISYPFSEIDKLLDDLPCLQCRAVLLEWLYQEKRHHHQQ